MMRIETVVVGPIETNCYLAYDENTKEAVVVDAGDDTYDIARRIDELGLQVKYLLNTHGHYDHIQAVDELRDKYGAKFAIHADDVELIEHPEKAGGLPAGFHGCKAPDLLLHNGDVISFGSYNLKVIYTPGHTRGCVCFYEANEKVCFTGDTLFRGTVGRCDLYGGNFGEMKKSVKERMAEIADDTAIYPGHEMESTMGWERKHNPYLK